MRYDQLLPLIDKAQPRTIVEIGSHSGMRAAAMCRRALVFGPVHYTGYDLFDYATAETNKREMNGKGSGELALAKRSLESVRAESPDGFTYELIIGDTRKTLHGKSIVADFVFIDGGHSVETIRGDYEAVAGSKVIVFDDYYLSGVNVAKFGCNEVVKDLPHYLLPQADRFGDLTIKMAVLR